MLGEAFKRRTDDLLRWQGPDSLSRKPPGTRSRSTCGPSWSSRSNWTVPRLRAHPGGAALRFAPTRRYRVDKSAADADVIERVRAMLPLHGS